MICNRLALLNLALICAAGSGLFAVRQLSAKSAPAGYVMHEWGTFTTVTGADGSVLAGLDREEETLPPFVHAHDGFCPPAGCGKGFARPLDNVTVKLETPVVYFYSPEALRATVRVGFRGGSISQWYPQRQGGETPPALEVSPGGEVLAGAIDFAKPYSGSVHWEVDVLPPGESSAAAVLDGSETPTWIYPRLTDSNLIEADNGRAEKYLFYRGVGRVDLPVAFSMPTDGTLRIANQSRHRVPYLLVFYAPESPNGAATPRILSLPGLDAGATTDVAMRNLKRPARWQTDVFATLSRALTDSGLYPKEAEAMIQTWWHSYFRTPGLRVFWIVPRAVTDQVLPMTLSPTPKELVRTLVGRAEVLTPAFENALLREYRATADPADFRSWDRFGQAYRERMEVLAGAPQSEG